MRSPPLDDEIDGLLADGRLGGPTKDRVFEGALRDAGVPVRRRSAWVRLSLAAGASVAVGAAALVLAPRLSHERDGFRAKGPTAQVQLDVACNAARGGSLAACPTGATLVFSVTGRAGGGYLAAYAEPLSGGERIWYFSADGEAPAVPGVGQTALVGRAIRLGAEHAPGEYRLRMFVTGAPLSRAVLLAHETPDGLLARNEVILRIIAAAPP